MQQPNNSNSNGMHQQQGGQMGFAQQQPPPPLNGGGGALLRDLRGWNPSGGVQQQQIQHQALNMQPLPPGSGMQQPPPVPLQQLHMEALAVHQQAPPAPAMLPNGPVPPPRPPPPPAAAGSASAAHPAGGSRGRGKRGSRWEGGNNSGRNSNWDSSGGGKGGCGGGRNPAAGRTPHQHHQQPQQQLPRGPGVGHALQQQLPGPPPPQPPPPGAPLVQQQQQAPPWQLPPPPPGQSVPQRGGPPPPQQQLPDLPPGPPPLAHQQMQQQLPMPPGVMQQQQQVLPPPMGGAQLDVLPPPPPGGQGQVVHGMYAAAGGPLSLGQPGMPPPLPQQQQQAQSMPYVMQLGQQQQVSSQQQQPQIVMTYLPSGQGAGGVVTGGPGSQRAPQRGGPQPPPGALPGAPPAVAAAGAGGGGGALAPPPPPPVMPTMAALLEATGGRLEDVLLVCSELPHFLARSNSSALSEADTQRVCEALSASLAAAGRSLQQSVLASPGVTAFYETMHGAQPQLSAAQQLQVLECLAAMHKAGCAQAPLPLITALADTVSGSNLLSDCSRFEAAAQALISLWGQQPAQQPAGPSSSGQQQQPDKPPAPSSEAQAALTRCCEALLSDSALRRVLREDADAGCKVLTAVLGSMAAAGLKLSKSVQEAVSKFLQDSLPRFSPATLAALLACHTSLGLGATHKLLRRCATEYTRRPEPHLSADMLLGVMAGLAADGSATIRELPQQLLTRLTDELQALLPNLRGPQLLKSVSCIANLGFVRSSKQQQLADQLLQQVSQQLLTPGVLLELPGLINSLAEAEATQSQPGLGAFIKKLQAVQDSREGALHAAAPVAVLGLVAGLQQHGKLEDGLELLPELQARALHSMRELCTSVAAGTAAAHAAAAAAVLAGAQEGAMQEALRLEQEQQQLIRALGLREWVLLVEAVRQLCGNSRSSSAGGASNSGDGSQATGDASLPVGAEEVALLLQAMIDTELLHCRVEQAAAAPPPPPPPASSNSNANNQQQQQVPAANGAVTPPPPPPPPAAATAAVRSNDGGASSDGGGSRAQAVLLPVVFGADDWRNLARLMTVCLEWYPLELLPLQLLQLMLEVLEAQAALGGMATCSKASAVQLLWGLGVAGALTYELWDALSSPLDSAAAGDSAFDAPTLQRVFEAYCLAVLRNSGPTPCEILMPQLVPAGQAFTRTVLDPAAAGRRKLLQALKGAGLAQGGAGVTQLQEGHMVLFDVYNADRKQAWMVAGTRSPLLCAAASRLLSAAGWVQLQLSVKELDRTASNPAQQAQRLVQLAKVADLLPRLSALIRDYRAKQQAKQQQKAAGEKSQPGGGGAEQSSSEEEDEDDEDELDEDDMQQLMQLVQYLTTSLANGTLLQTLQEKQLAYLEHIAGQYAGPTQAQLPVLPPLGAARATRQQQQEEAALAAAVRQQKQRGPPWALDESSIDPASLVPGSISIQEVFALNRNGPAATALDPGWYGQRLLALPPEVKEGTPAASAAAAAEATSMQAAATAAFVLNCRLAKAAAEAAAAAEAEAQAAAAAGAAGVGHQAGDVEMVDADGGAYVRGRSPNRAPVKRRRHWRDSRSRSRSCSVDSATSTSTRDSSNSSGRGGGGGGGGGRAHSSDSEGEHSSGSGGPRDRSKRRRGSSGAGGAAAAAAAKSEDGAASEEGSEEGQVAEGGGDEEWAKLFWERRQSSGSGDAAAAGGSSAPVSFAARGTHRPDYSAVRQQHNQKHQRQALKRGRPRSRSRSRSNDSRDRGADRDDRRRQQRGYRGYSRSRSRSPGHAGTDAAAPTTRAAQGSAAGTKFTSSMPAAAAAKAAAARYGMQSAYGMAAMQSYAMQQQQAAVAAAAAAAAAKQQQQQQQQQQQFHFEGPGGREKLLALFTHMPAVRTRLQELLQEGWFVPPCVKQSALVLMLQLDETKLLNVLNELQAQMAQKMAQKKAESNAAAAAGAGGAGGAGGSSDGGDIAGAAADDAAAAPAAAAAAAAVPDAEWGKFVVDSSLVNGWLVALCKRMGAKPLKACKKSAAVGAVGGLPAYAAAAVRQAGFAGGWGSYMAAAAAAAGGGGGAGGGGASSSGAGKAAEAAKSAAAAAAGYGKAGKIGGYMLVNGMLVPVDAKTAAALAARQGGYGYGGLAAAAGTGSGGGATAAAGGGASSSLAGAAAAKAARAATAAVAAAGGGGGGVGGKKGKGKSSSSYWDALNSGLDAEGDIDGEKGEGQEGK